LGGAVGVGGVSGVGEVVGVGRVVERKGQAGHGPAAGVVGPPAVVGVADEILHAEHKAMTMVAILQMARHIYNVYSGNNDTEWEVDKERVMEEIGISAEGLKEFEEDVYDTLKSQ